MKPSSEVASVQPVKIRAQHGLVLEGELTIPPNTEGVVLFAHGSGSSRHSARNRFVARAIQDAGTATLLFDLLTRTEEEEDSLDGHLRFDIELLVRRLTAATEWVLSEPATAHFRIGYFGASTGGAAALGAAADMASRVGAVVSRGGRPDLAGPALLRVQAPTLLIVGERDDLVVELNQEALAQLRCPKKLVVVPHATHLFEERGALDRVAELAADWFRQHLKFG
jgi:dienelactone hydrolase